MKTHYTIGSFLHQLIVELIAIQTRITSNPAQMLEVVLRSLEAL